MGRRAGKLKVEFIENQKPRNLAFKRRNQCLIKKIQELSTLCDVKAFMVLFDPGHDANPAAVWPPNDPAQVRGLIEEFKGDDEKSPNPMGVFLQKKTQLARARIDRLKQRGGLMGDDADQEQFGPFDENSQFGHTIDLDNPLNDDVDEGLIEEFMGDDEKAPNPIGVFLQKKAQLARARIDRLKQRGGLMGGDADQEQFQFRPFDENSQFGQTIDNSSTGLMMPRGPLNDNVDELAQFVQAGIDDQYQQHGHGMVDDSTYPQQQLLYQIFDSSSPSMYEEEDISMMMMPPRDPDPMMMLMMDDAEQSCCNSGMAGFEDQEGASCSTQTAGGDDEDTAVQDFYDRTPPMMMWQSTTDDDNLVFTQFEDKGPADYLKYIDFDNFWV